MLLDVALHRNIKAWKANNIIVVSFAEHWIQDGLIVTFSENIKKNSVGLGILGENTMGCFSRREHHQYNGQG